MKILSAVMAMVVLSFVGACSEAPEPEPEDDRLDADGNPCQLYDDSGPYEVGLVEVELDGGVPVALFYPAGEEAGDRERASYDMRDFLPEDDRDMISDEDAPIYEMNAARDGAISADGPFPVVLFSHGLSGYRYQSSELMVHLASWGFVVASAEHRERNLAHVLEEFGPDGDDAPQTLRDIVEYLGDENQDSTSAFAGALDLTTMAATGHSMGGNGAASMIGEPGVKAAIFYASGPSVEDSQDVELFWQGGTTDGLVTMAQVRSSFEASDSPKRLLGIEDAGHLAFSDICAVGAEDGGVLAIAADSGIDVPTIIEVLGRDGCRDTDLDASDAWPIIHHYSVAHLRGAFGIDDEPVGLSEATVGCFDEVTDLEYDAM